MRIKAHLHALLVAVLLHNLTFAQSTTNQRVALVIGVMNYQYVSPLRNTLNDARDMAAALKKTGFQVIELYDPQSKRQLQDAIMKYFQLLRQNKNAAGMLFYSGHGMQVEGVNYLIPAMANPQIKADLDDQCLNMDYVMSAIEQAGNPLNIFILDACRNNPFKGFYRSGEQGLSMVATPKGSYIVYATKPGSVASDGSGRNGLFTSKLLKYLLAEGLNIEQVFKRVAADVSAESNDAQRPWIASDYTGDFYFTNGNNPTQAPGSEGAVGVPNGTGTGSADISEDFGYAAGVVKIATIGRQDWAGANLNTSKFANGDLIPRASSHDAWRKAGKDKLPVWCYYDNDSTNSKKYGKLYNWYAVTDERGLCPSGWHVPSDKEWENLMKVLGPEAGNLLKSKTDWKQNTGSDTHNFSAMPGGDRGGAGSFGSAGDYGLWWSTTEHNTGSAFNRSLNYKNGSVRRGSEDKNAGFSVRCLRD